ncbi:hypothetical protein M5K25_026841 [Dendrobium thyrsiflorum]|uniref:Reverse transcriptase zinc-binding domain-containing protein n=1 Tax=Dendrobium thyrsiflorum TaxID=117978 RepID=A0ABD0TYH7_DENTH
MAVVLPRGEIPSALGIPLLRISDLVAGGNWSFPHNFLSSLHNVISANLFFNSSVDCPLWCGSKHPTFKSFMEEFYKDMEVVSWFSFVWHKCASIQFSYFAWLAMNGGLKTTDQLILRSVSAQPICLFVTTTINLFLIFFLIIEGTLSWVLVFLLRPNIMQIFNYIKGYSQFSKAMKKFLYVVICASI